MLSLTNKPSRIMEKMTRREYRRSLVRAQIGNTIANQIRLLRKRERWEQGDLAKALGAAQPLVSRLEDPEYGKYTVSTLLRLAEAFDVALVVRFAPFSELADWHERTDRASLCPPPFAKDYELAASEPNASTSPMELSRQSAGEIRADVEVIRPRPMMRDNTVELIEELEAVNA